MSAAAPPEGPRTVPGPLTAAGSIAADGPLAARTPLRAGVAQDLLARAGSAGPELSRLAPVVVPVPACGAAGAARFPEPAPPAGRAKRLRNWLTPRVPRLAGPLTDRDAGFGILMYHRFADPVPGLPEPTWNVPPAVLREQLAGLLDRRFVPARLDDLLDARLCGEPIDSRAFAVTIDDGYLNNLTAALPVFEALNIPATLFVATGYLGSPAPYPFDDWAAKGDPRVPRESWAPMTVPECRRFAASPLISLGVHTHTHQDFRGRPRAFAADVAESCRILRRDFGVENPAFAFPYGTPEIGYSRGELAAALRGTPVRAALTTADERVRPGTDPFDWGRFTATADDTAATLAAKLDGRFEALKNVTGRLHRGGACAAGVAE